MNWETKVLRTLAAILALIVTLIQIYGCQNLSQMQKQKIDKAGREFINSLNN